MNEKNIVECLYARSTANGQAPVYYFEGSTVTFSQLQQAAEQLAGALSSQGIKAGDRVAILMNDSPAMAEAILATMGIGATPVLVSTMLGTVDLAHILNDAQPVSVIVSGSHVGQIETVKAQIGGNAALRIVDSSQPVDGYLQLDVLRKQGQPMRLNASAQDALMLYTSGSTGRPKGVVHKHAGIMATLKTMGAQVYGLTPKEKLFSASRMFFAYGFGNSFSFPIGLGAPAVLCAERPTPSLIVDTLQRHEITVFFAVPSVFRLVADELRKIGKGALPSLKFSAAGGENLTAKTFNDWKDLTGTVILETIGTTELLHGFLTNTLDAINPASSGKVTPGYQVKLVDEEGMTHTGAGRGSIWVKGGSTFDRYWNNPEATAKSIDGDWVGTGDLYRCDDEGFYYFEGRGDDMIKVSGMWVSPVDVEQALLETHQVKESAVVGKQGSDGIFEIQAYVVPNQTGIKTDQLVQDLTQYVESKLPRYKRPKSYFVVTELPRNPTGKVQRFKLRQR